jgi:hypothetical protein
MDAMDGFNIATATDKVTFQLQNDAGAVQSRTILGSWQKLVLKINYLDDEDLGPMLDDGSYDIDLSKLKS